MGKGSKRRPGDDEEYRKNYDRIFSSPDSEHPCAMECPLCSCITLVPAEDEHSQDWTCESCGAEVSFP